MMTRRIWQEGIDIETETDRRLLAEARKRFEVSDIGAVFDRVSGQSARYWPELPAQLAQRKARAARQAWEENERAMHLWLGAEA